MSLNGDSSLKLLWVKKLLTNLLLLPSTNRDVRKERGIHPGYEGEGKGNGGQES